MRITLLTYGSRGDFQPFLALAVGLQKAGHSPRLAGPARFEQVADQFQVPFSVLAGDPAEISVRFNNAGTNPVRVARSIRDYVYDIAPLVTKDARAALVEAEMVIHSFLFTTGGHSFARELGVPDISVQTFPVFAPTRSFPNVVFSSLPPGPLSYLTHWLVTQVFWYGGNTSQPRFTKSHPQDFPVKLSWPFKQTDDRPVTPLVFAYSPSVLPRPVDWSMLNIHIPGYFFLDEPDYQPPEKLVEFLQAGEPPVCISFGSMVHRDAEQIERIVLEALAQTGQRGVILTGWGGELTSEPSENVLALEAASHAWLLPHCKAVVHHGGAGTTGAGLRAGIPNLVVPFAGDQPFWGKRVEMLGAGPRPIPVKRLSTQSLSTALQQAVEDQSMQKKAARIGEKIRAEQGVGETVHLVEQWTEKFRK
jgi:sterol 3beta-glucosyltransferase